VFEEQPDRGPPTSLRGWLSDVYLPVLLDEAEGSLAALTLRLGERAAVDDRSGSKSTRRASRAGISRRASIAT
jgi:hypothetical protein